MENFLFVVVSFIIVIITSLIHKGSPVKRSVDGIPVFILGLDVGDDCFPVVAEDPADLEGIGSTQTCDLFFEGRTLFFTALSLPPREGPCSYREGAQANLHLLGKVQGRPLELLWGGPQVLLSVVVVLPCLWNAWPVLVKAQRSETIYILSIKF